MSVTVILIVDPLPFIILKPLISTSGDTVDPEGGLTIIVLPKLLPLVSLWPLIVVRSLPFSERSIRSFSISRFSVYVPSWTMMVSPGVASSMASWIGVEPGVGSGYTSVSAKLNDNSNNM